MRDKLIAVVLLIVILLSVTANELAIRRNIDETTESLRELETSESKAKDKAESIFADFLNKEHYISLTVSHDDLTSIEEGFCDMIGYLKIGDADNAEVAKGRLIHSLEHLRRLSGINIDSII